MANIRAQKMQSLIRDEIGKMIVAGIVKDPRVSSFISVTSVEISKDAAYAKVYVSSIEGNKKLTAAVDALNHAAGFIQARLGKRIRARYTPRLSFYMDRSPLVGFEMTKKLEDLES